MTFLTDFSYRTPPVAASEKEISNFLFRDIFISNVSNNLTSTIFHTSTRPFTELYQFYSRIYITRLIKCLVNRAYKINNTWIKLNGDLLNTTNIQKRNSYTTYIVDKVIKKYTKKKVSTEHSQIAKSDTSKLRYIKLPYIEKMSQQLHNELQKLFKQCCKKFLVFNSRALISQISCSP